MLSRLFKLFLLVGSASALNLTVASSGGNASSPLAYGLMFEDINHSGDGGLYAELISNRAFQGSAEYPASLYPWVPSSNAVLTLQNTSVPLSPALPLSVNVAGNGTIGLVNPGWWGIDVKPQTYTGSFWSLGLYKGHFTAKLKSNITGDVFASTNIPSSSQSGKWVEHKFKLEPNVTAPTINNTLVLEFSGGGNSSLNFNLISLFPPTYNDRPNGNRIELMEALKGLNPSFLRFPGGNNIEGDSPYQRPWKWNETIGPLKDRPGRPGTWGYSNTDGLGLIEYLEWCDDLEMEPLLAVWSGLYLNGYVDPPDVLTADELAPYVQDTLNELEFIMGSVNTTYGALRASLGYPKPWVIKYIEVGNEDNLGDGGDSYASYRFSMFYDAITPLYPNITIISSTGDLTAVGPGSATDFHEYTRPDQFVSQFGYFDNNDRSHGILLGEYAHIQGNMDTVTGVNWSAPRLQWGIWDGAVGEAVYLLGSERNGDVIIGASYAPTLQDLNSYEWAPDLITYTASPSQTVLSVSYHMISLFSNSRVTSSVPISSPLNQKLYDPAYYSAGLSSPGHYIFKAAIYNSTSSVPFSIAFEGLAEGTTAELTVLNTPSGLSSNVLDGENVVEKTVTELGVANGVIEFELENYDVAVLKT